VVWEEVTQVQVDAPRLQDRLSQSQLFVDLSALCVPGSEAVLLNGIASVLKARGKYVIIPSGVVNEIGAIALANHVNSKACQRAQRSLHQLHAQGLIRVMPDEGLSARDLFRKLATGLPDRMTLLTQDTSLAAELEGPGGGVGPVETRRVLCWTIKQDQVHDFRQPLKLPPPSGSAVPQGTPPPGQVQGNGYAKPRVQYPSAVVLRTADETVISASPIGEGAQLISSRFGAVRLVKMVGRPGGEGTVYSTDQAGLVAKVYHPHRLTRGRKAKIELMVSRGLDWNHPDAKGICWPLDLLTDSKGIFRGYLMPRATGKPLGETVLIGRDIIRTCPGWDRRQLVSLCIAITRKIRFLHDSGIILGDINPLNILVEDDETVFLVDTDSFQIEGFACPVGTPHFTAPEILGADFATFLRRPEHEAFAVATLLFMILFCGQKPYAGKGGGSPTENIRNMEFPYPLGKESRRTVPEGQYRNIWSWLIFDLKEKFYYSFEKSKQPFQRLSAAEWLPLLRKYEAQMEQGTHTTELFPTTMKRGNVPSTELRCQRCGGSFEIANDRLAEMQAQGKQIPTRCHTCRVIERQERADRQSVAYSSFCRNCNSSFSLTKGEVEFYQGRGMELPRKCEECRKRNRSSSSYTGGTTYRTSASSQSNQPLTIWDILNSLFKF
jgi:serine/threonine protein kinase